MLVFFPPEPEVSTDWAFTEYVPAKDFELTLKFHVTVPFAPVVAVWVVVPPLGPVKVNVTLAPEAGVPPLVTDAVIGTVPGVVKLDPETETLTASVGGVITVAFAVPVALDAVLVALRFTAYVLAGVPDGAPLPIATETDCPGLNVSDDEESEVVHPEGTVDPRLNVLDGQAELSLLATVTE